MNDDGDTRTTYAQLAGFIDDHTDGTEDGHLKINTMTAGSVTEHLHIGNQKISGSVTTTGSFGHLIVSEGDSGQTAQTNVAKMVVESDDSLNGIQLLGGTSQRQFLLFGDDNADVGFIEYSHIHNHMRLVTNSQESFNIAGGESGRISGSATSTGSFWLLQTTDRIAVANNDLKIKGNLTLDGANVPELHIDGLVDAVVRIDKAASYRAAHLRFDTAGSADWFIGTPDSDTYGDGDELYFGTSQDTPIVAIDPQATTGLLSLTSNRIIISGSVAGNQNDDGGLVLDLHNAYNPDDARTSIRFWSKDSTDTYGARLRFHHPNNWSNGAGTFSLAMRAFDGSGLKDVIAVDGKDYNLTFPNVNKISGSAASTGSFGSLGVGGDPSLGKLQVNTTVAKRGIVVNATDSNASYMQFTNSSTGTTTGDGLQIGFQSDESGFIALQENTDLVFNTNSIARMTIASGGVISGDFNDTSDIALKENIFEISSSYEQVKQLNPITFNWKEEEEKGTDEQIGFIAQEVEKVYPELVRGEEGSKSINVVGLVSVLTKTVQELTQKVEELEKKLQWKYL